MNNNVYTYRKYLSYIYEKSHKGTAIGDIYESIMDIFKDDVNVGAISIDSLEKQIVITFKEINKDVVSKAISIITPVVQKYVYNNIGDNTLDGFPDFLNSANLFDNWILGNTLTIRL